MIEYDSDEERWFTWWLEELKLNGYIDSWKYHPKPFPLSEKIVIHWEKQLKTKTKAMIKTMLQEHNYQADFLVRWTDKAKGIFFASSLKENVLAYPFVVDYIENGDYYRTIIDVKGIFNQNDAWRRFSIDQKWVWQRYSIYVQKAIPKKLFQETFTPIRFLQTDKSKKARKLNYVPVSLFDYLNNL